MRHLRQLWTVLVCVGVLQGATCAVAETKLTPSAFEAFVANKTLFFEQRGMPYGAEQYLDNRTVIWTFLNGECQRGVWFDRDEDICFWYEGQPEPSCWSFFSDDGTYRARVLGDDPINDLVVTGETTQPLQCPGPSVGVSYDPG